MKLERAFKRDFLFLALGIFVFPQTALLGLSILFFLGRAFEVSPMLSVPGLFMDRIALSAGTSSPALLLT